MNDPPVAVGFTTKKFEGNPADCRFARNEVKFAAPVPMAPANEPAPPSPRSLISVALRKNPFNCPAVAEFDVVAAPKVPGVRPLLNAAVKIGNVCCPFNAAIDVAQLGGGVRPAHAVVAAANR